MTAVDTVVVGAGPAGLATSRELQRRHVDHVVLEGSHAPGHTWENLYDSLTLHSGKHMSSLPGLGFPRSAPVYLGRGQFLDYLRRYARDFALPVRTDFTVDRIERHDGGWKVSGAHGAYDARVVVVATGIVSNPRVPTFPGQDGFAGRVMHSAAYRRPHEFVGRRVLVVGVGNSGAEIAAELGGAGATVAVAVRSGANVVPLKLLGIPIQYVARYLRHFPRAVQEGVVALIAKIMALRHGPPVIPLPDYSPLDVIPLIGFHLPDAIRRGVVRVKPGVEGFTERAVRFADGSEERFDVVILATGFNAVLGPLGSLVRVDPKGFALRTDRVTSADQPDLYFVGHNHDNLGALFNICIDAPVVADRIAGFPNNGHFTGA